MNNGPDKRSAWAKFPVIVVAALAAVAGLWLLRPGQPAAGPEAHRRAPPMAGEAATTAAPEQPASDELELQPQSPGQRASAPQMPVVVQPPSRSTATGGPGALAGSRPEPTPYTRQLVSALTKLDLSHGAISKEQAEQWKQTLQALVAQGAAAVPAIREFLEQNLELNFAALAGADQLGQSSLRGALIAALAQIGGPEAQALMAQTLQTTTLPSEAAQLAQYLEQQAPGQYRQQTVAAISEILAMAQKNQLPAGSDVGPLFQVLQKFGDDSSASLLQQLGPQWRYYATLSLAGMDGGAGVPGLVRETQDASSGGTRDFALQLLAQQAVQYPEAASALLEQARANQFSDATWRKIITGLAGDQYQLGSPPAALGPSPSGLKTYHIASGNQNFYSLPVADNARTAQRLDLITQLLNTTSNPSTVAALQSARDSLSPSR